MNSAEERAGTRTYVGVFMVTLVALMYEILLTRIFSVTMYYHFAFMAISIAMFGMTVGGIVVYLHPAYSRQDQAVRQMGHSSFLFAVWIVIGVLTHLFVPFHPGTSLKALASMVVTFGALSAAFVYSGICICLALTRFPRQVSRIYAVDLAGAASGCVFLIGVFKVTDGLSAVILAALLAALASLLFSSQTRHGESQRTTLLYSALLAALAMANTITAWRGVPFLDLIWVKGRTEEMPLYEKWNSFSRLTVFGDPNVPMSPVSEGTSPTYPTNRAVCALPLTIDSSAETTLTAFAGDLNTVDYLKYDVKEIVHYLRQNSKVLIMGAGGGRDILAALALGQESVRAVEMNQDILATVNGRFGAFTGHLDRNPRITFVNDEARSYLARSNEKFDVIQASFIDTWAATAAGAFSLTENGLYTVEAWELFLSRLTPSGVISFSRWFTPGRPQEAYRLTSLAAATLERRGISNPRRHIILVRNAWGQTVSGYAGGAATMLVSLAPFSDTDIDKVEAVAHQMRFPILLTPRVAADSTFADLASGQDSGRVIAGLRSDISPPTDNRPFFFQMGRIGDMFRPARSTRAINEVTDAAHLLGTMLVSFASLAVLCIVLPLWVAGKKLTLPTAWPHALYFATIGLGFMLIEVSQMERLIIFLGHPTYALSVVLFTLLLSSGLGSYTTHGTGKGNLRRVGAVRLGILVGVLGAFGIYTPRALVAFESAATPLRILVGVGILFPLGFLLGMAFPLGMKSASEHEPNLTPWLWGINGATSVCASVLAVVISLYAGISAAFWTGMACYAVAWVAFLWASQGTREQLPAVPAEAGVATT
jgi:spermidine synthase